jgi:Fe-S-cluster containining protein
MTQKYCLVIVMPSVLEASVNTAVGQLPTFMTQIGQQITAIKEKARMKLLDASKALNCMGPQSADLLRKETSELIRALYCRSFDYVLQNNVWHKGDSKYALQKKDFENLAILLSNNGYVVQTEDEFKEQAKQRYNATTTGIGLSTAFALAQEGIDESYKGIFKNGAKILSAPAITAASAIGAKVVKTHLEESNVDIKLAENDNAKLEIVTKMNKVLVRMNEFIRKHPGTHKSSSQRHIAERKHRNTTNISHVEEEIKELTDQLTGPGMDELSRTARGNAKRAINTNISEMNIQRNKLIDLNTFYDINNDFVVFTKQVQKLDSQRHKLMTQRASLLERTKAFGKQLLRISEEHSNTKSVSSHT